MVPILGHPIYTLKNIKIRRVVMVSVHVIAMMCLFETV